MKTKFNEVSGGITAAPGFLASGIHCGIRKNREKRDLALIVADRLCAAAAVYTTNKVKAAPLYLTMENLKDGHARAILVNSGNANACAPGGLEAAQTTVAAAAKAAGLKPEDFIVNSTGVIGQALPVDTMVMKMPELVNALSPDGCGAAEAIMTTDTFVKTHAVEFTVGGTTITLGGMAKGSGMIHPDMATMLAFLTTNICIEPDLLQEALRESAACTYNRISVDGDTSTNDMTAILASGAAKNPIIDAKNENYFIFLQVLNEVNLKLAKDIARDGEGATKLIICRVKEAASEETAVALAKSVISSSLVKAMVFGEDANVGRVLCAMGYAGVDFEPQAVDIIFASAAGQVMVCQNGIGLAFDEGLALIVLKEKEITIEVHLHSGTKTAEAYGCDLTYDYVKINGDYRT
jgi:glutamate N-acetyltransferase/amino-acid N-acetyltransferase